MDWKLSTTFGSPVVLFIICYSTAMVLIEDGKRGSSVLFKGN